MKLVIIALTSTYSHGAKALNRIVKGAHEVLLYPSSFDFEMLGQAFVPT